MRKQPATQLRKSINYISFKIDKIKDRIDECEKSNQLYNRLIIERANARKKLKEIESRSLIKTVLQKISLKKQPKRICDYFPASSS